MWGTYFSKISCIKKSYNTRAISLAFAPRLLTLGSLVVIVAVMHIDVCSSNAAATHRYGAFDNNRRLAQLATIFGVQTQYFMPCGESLHLLTFILLRSFEKIERLFERQHDRCARRRPIRATAKEVARVAGYVVAPDTVGQRSATTIESCGRTQVVFVVNLCEARSETCKKRISSIHES